MLKTLRVVDFEILRVRQELPNTESTKVTVGNTIPFSLKWPGDQFKNSHSKLQLIKHFYGQDVLCNISLKCCHLCYLILISRITPPTDNH